MTEIELIFDLERKCIERLLRKSRRLRVLEHMQDVIRQCSAGPYKRLRALEYMLAKQRDVQQVRRFE